MIALQKPRLTPEEYLAIERAAPSKSEFVNGEMFAMAGGSPPHALIAANAIVALGTRLRGGPCRPYSSDLRVHVPETGLYTYPDVSVVCGSAQFVSDKLDNLTNPSLLVEVVSPSTEKFDRGGKFLHYQRIATLRDFLLISQNEARVEHYARQSGQLNQWLLTVVTGLESMLALPSLGIELPLAEIYDGVTLPDVPPPPPFPGPGEDRFLVDAPPS